MADQSRVIHGPPGTGKSQTITNLIASLAANLNQVEKSLESAGASKVVADIRSRKPEAALWPHLHQFVWLASCLDSVSQTDPEIGGFIGATHGRYVDEFTHLDEERIALTVDRVRRAHGERARLPP